ncbi:LPXTG cell wall anchor domain-containing protein, partial [Enterococcus faecium]
VIPPAIFFYYSTLFDSRFKTLQQNLSVNNSEELPVDKIAIQGYGTHAPPAFYRDSRSALHLPNFNQYTLPAAGGKGMIASIILGIMVMGCGVLYYLHPKTRRKSSQSN